MRVVTYNLLHGIDLATGQVGLGAAAAALARLDADVVALQEVDRHLPRSGEVDQVAELAARLGLHGVFAPALAGDPDHRWQALNGADPGGQGYGVGLLSRFPLEAVERTALPGGGDGERRRPARLGNPGWDHEPRLALSAEVATPAGPLRVTTTHVSYLPWRGLAQVRRAAAAAAGPAGHPALLLGDLNLPPWPVRLALRDWRHAGGAPTYPAWSPRVQVDQALVSGPVSVLGVEVAETTSSDHLPLVVRLRLDN